MIGVCGRAGSETIVSWMEDGDDVGSCHVILYSLHAFPYEVAEDTE